VNVAQSLWYRDHPVPHWGGRNDVIHGVRGGLREAIPSEGAPKLLDAATFMDGS
jgi:hypothetical protein